MIYNVANWAVLCNGQVCLLMLFRFYLSIIGVVVFVLCLS